jgi:hypothetical protein
VVWADGVRIVGYTEVIQKRRSRKSFFTDIWGARSCDLRDFGLNVSEHIEAAQHTCNCEVILRLADQGHWVRGVRWLKMYERAPIGYDEKGDFPRICDPEEHAATRSGGMYSDIERKFCR